MRTRVVVLLTTCVAASAVAEEPVPPAAAPAGAPHDGAQTNRRLGAANAAELDSAGEGPEPFTLDGYAEAFGQWNFNAPSNGITHLRGFDNRHATFTLANVALDGQWDSANIVGRITLQFGHTPATYYMAEPALAGAAGTNGTSATLWQVLQQAYAGFRAPVLDGLLVQAGLFLSPIGPEGMSVKDNWNFSRSNLFFGLPFYHSGFRATLGLTGEWAVTLAAYNGWNSVVDNNVEKSVSLQLTWAKPESMAWSFVYFGGVERAPGAVEGRAWRHLVDTHFTWFIDKAFTVIAHANAGAEPNALGLSAWAAGALYLRWQALAWLFVAARADAFGESTPAGASSIFWPVPWMSSGTLTLDARPADRVSVRLEYRHDAAGGNAFFGGGVTGSGTVADPFVPDRAAQDTLTLGMVSWF